MDDLAKNAKDSARVKRSWEKRRHKKKWTREDWLRAQGINKPRTISLAQLAERDAALMFKSAADSARVKRSWLKRRRARRRFVVQDGLDSHNGFQAWRKEIYDAWEKAGSPGTVQDFARNYVPKRRVAKKADWTKADANKFRIKERTKGPHSDAWLATHPNKKSTPKEIVGHHGHRPHGPSILWPALYEHLRAKGKSKAAAAAISNAAWKKKKVGMKTNTPTSVRGVVKSDDYEALIEKARRVRTEAGAKRYGVPIGSPIPSGPAEKAVVNMSRLKARVGPPPGGSARQKRVHALARKLSQEQRQKQSDKRVADAEERIKRTGTSLRPRSPKVSGRQQRVAQLARRMKARDDNHTLDVWWWRSRDDESLKRLGRMNMPPEAKKLYDDEVRRRKDYAEQTKLISGLPQMKKRGIDKASPDASEVHMGKAMEKVMVNSMRRKRMKKMKGKGGKDC